MAKRIYLDYATTTPVDPAVLRAMRSFWSKTFGNPSSLHTEGVNAKHELDLLRQKVARILEARISEVYFTSGGTEANNLAIRGVVGAISKSIPFARMHIVTTVIEHSSVLEPIRELERSGIKVTYLPVGGDGIVDVRAFQKALRPETVLVSVMYANNEIGAIQPIRKISRALADFRKTLSPRPQFLSSFPFFHTDACQASLYCNVGQDYLGADLISFDGHKMYGPKGVGALYVRNGTPISPVLLGGGQEHGLRPGTEALPLIAGFTEAFSLAIKRRAKESKRISILRDYFFKKAQKMFPKSIANGSLLERLPNNINLAFPGLDAEFAVLQIDALGILCSAKSACIEGERDSYVVKALGRNDGTERSSLRFTLGRSSIKNEIDKALRALLLVCKRQKI